MSHHESDPLQHPEVQMASTAQYVSAFVLAMGVLVVSCILTVGFDMSALHTLICIGVLALIAVVGQLYLFFRLDLSEAMIWHTLSALATIPLFFIAIILTMWMFHYLAMRVMIGA